MSSCLALLRRCGQFLTQELRKKVVCTLVLGRWSTVILCFQMAPKIILKNFSESKTKQHGWFLNIPTGQTSTWTVLHNKSTRYNILRKSCDTHTYNIRHAAAGRFSVTKTNTNSSQPTAECRSAMAWNKLPTSLTTLNSK